MANVSFHRKTTAGQKVITEGAITFNTADQMIYVGTGSSYHVFSCPTNHSASNITKGRFPNTLPLRQQIGQLYRNIWGQNIVSARDIIEAGMSYDGMDASDCEGAYYNICQWTDGMPDASMSYGPWIDYIPNSFSTGFSYMHSIDVKLDLYTLFNQDYTSLKSGASSYSLPKALPIHCVRCTSQDGGNTEFVGHFVVPLYTSAASQTLRLGVGTLTLFAEGTNAAKLQYCQIESKSRSDKVRNEADTGAVYNYYYYTTATVGCNINSSGALTPSDLYYEYWDGYQYESHVLLESRITVVACNVNS